MAISRRRFLQAVGGVVIGGGPLLGCIQGGQHTANRFKQLQMNKEGFPKSFYMWTHSRRLVKQHAQDKADMLLQKYQGTMVASDQLQWFAKYKQRHPDQFVYLFTQGQVFSETQSQYDPIDRSNLFAGHWVYFEGSPLRDDVAAEAGAVEIPIEDTSLFRMHNFGQRVPDDVALLAMNDDGTVNYNYSEQCKLQAIHEERGTITLERGCYNTQPRAFKAGHSIAAAHAGRGWGDMSWAANYSLRCPRDAQGRQAKDIILEKFASLFGEGGATHNYTGLNMDAIATPVGKLSRDERDLDTDGDNQPDNGIVDGANLYTAGHHLFCQQMRERLGPDVIFTTDGQGGGRAFGPLNGIETEWWPSWNDMTVAEWSTGMNRNLFWQANTYGPHFSYINHKIGGHDEEAFWDLPWNRHRLVLAAAQLLGVATTVMYQPDPAPGETIGVWDELVMGTEDRTGWLGQPVEEAVGLGRQTPNVLGDVTSENLAKKVDASSTSKTDGEWLRVHSTTEDDQVRFRLRDVPVNGPDLLLTLSWRGTPLRGYPGDLGQQIGRAATVTIAPSHDLRLESFLNTSWFTPSFYFRDVQEDTVDVVFNIEGRGHIDIRELSVHAAPDATYRMFENGLVLANPANHPFAFDLQRIDPDNQYRRLQGSTTQDPQTNNGQPVGDEVTLGPLDGLFLVKQ